MLSFLEEAPSTFVAASRREASYECAMAKLTIAGGELFFSIVTLLAEAGPLAWSVFVDLFFGRLLLFDDEGDWLQEELSPKLMPE